MSHRSLRPRKSKAFIFWKPLQFIAYKDKKIIYGIITKYWNTFIRFGIPRQKDMMRKTVPAGLHRRILLGQHVFRYRFFYS